MTAPSLTPDELASIVSSLHEGVQVIDHELRYRYLNAAAAVHARAPAATLIGRTMMECYPGIEATPMFALLSGCLRERRVGSMENEFRYPDGRTRIFELSFQPCDVGLVILSIDVTERRTLERQLRVAQKMEAIGRLAGSVAHDFNNALSVILSFSSLILDELPAHDPLHVDVLAIKRAGERAADLTRQLLAFSRQQVVAPRLLDPARALAESANTLRRLVGEDVELLMHLEREASQVLIDAGHFDQVIMNLVVNARDAMPRGGRLTIETRRVELDASYTNEHFGVTPGPYILIAVSDTGVGMDRGTQQRIFEPFFTTKEPGKGTGLGLSTVFGIVKQCAGSVWVYSEPGAGATFKVYLPVATADVAPAVFEVQDPVRLDGRETILLVEDQDDVRVVTREVLRRYGYTVLEARNGGEALLLCERHAAPIELLLTDVVMPHMGGRELAERLAQLRPDMRVMFMSGYTENGALTQALIDPGVVYLQKPIVPQALARQVRRALDAPAHARAEG